MAFNFPPFSIAFFVAAFLALLFAIISWNRRMVPGAVPLTFFLLAIVVWTFSRSLEAGAVDFGDKVFWGKMEFLGILSSGVLWLTFSLDYVGSRWWKKPSHLFLLFIFPIVSLIIIWTNQWHGWY